MSNELDIPRGIIKQDSIVKKRKVCTEPAFHIPEEAKTPGMEYRWAAASIFTNGDEKLTENLENAAKDGWLPLSRAANPQLMNERRNHYSFGDYIMEGSSILLGRLVNKKQIEFDNCIIPSLTEESNSLINTLKEIEMRKNRINC